jgi:methyltransferase (TIGR00027 family)
MASAKVELISGVSATASWMAATRANESRRSDAIFQDPLAALLAGDQGRKIVRSMPRRAMVHWGVVARTSAIDRLILDVLDSGVDTVVNLGAGLDTRPYRMPLPASLRWIEFDFPDVVAEKNQLLAEHRPMCRLERVGVDLSDRDARTRALSECATRSTNVLALTEGVISYFTNAEVKHLADDLLAISSIRAWIQDFDNAGRRPLPVGWEKKLKAAPFQFQVDDWFDFFRAAGWRPLKSVTTLEESERIGRPYPLDFPYGLLIRVLPKDMIRKILSLSGIVVLERRQA